MLRFIELSRDDRESTGRLGKLVEGDQIDLHIKRKNGAGETFVLPPEAAELVETLLGYLSTGARVAIMTGDQDVTPNEAARILGISRPLVVHRMETGDLPFHYVGKHRRSAIADVVALKTKLEAQRHAMAALAKDALDLERQYGV